MRKTWALLLVFTCYACAVDSAPRAPEDSDRISLPVEAELPSLRPVSEGRAPTTKHGPQGANTVHSRNLLVHQWLNYDWCGSGPTDCLSRSNATYNAIYFDANQPDSSGQYRWNTLTRLDFVWGPITHNGNYPQNTFVVCTPAECVDATNHAAWNGVYVDGTTSTNSRTYRRGHIDYYGGDGWQDWFVVQAFIATSPNWQAWKLEPRAEVTKAYFTDGP